MKFTNLTPNTVTIRTEAGDTVIPPSGIVARVEIQTVLDEVQSAALGVPVHQVHYGDVRLPEEVDPYQDVLVVSKMFAEAYRWSTRRQDVSLFVPDNGPSAVREDGRIVAVRQLLAR